MSEKTRQALGIILIIVCLMICLIPMTKTVNRDEIHFRSGLLQGRGIPANETERNGFVLVNQADADDLTVLPGVGETLASLIIAEREKNGPYYYAEDLESVKGIGPRTIEKFRGTIDLSQEEGRE